MVNQRWANHVIRLAWFESRKRFARFESRIGDTNRKFCKRRSESRITNRKKYLLKNESWFALWFVDSSHLSHEAKSPKWTQKKLLKQCTVHIDNSLVCQICRTPQFVYLIKDYINKIINKYKSCFFWRLNDNQENQ